MDAQTNFLEQPIDSTENEANNAVVTPKTIDIFSAFAVTLKRIHIRLIAEGYVVKEGQISKSEKLIGYEQSSKYNRKNRR